MVEIKGLNKFYGKFIALNNLDLHIDKGELFGFVGPNGAGKTTTMKILSGLLKASGGEVYVAGIDAIRQSTELKAMIGYMPVSLVYMTISRRSNIWNSMHPFMACMENRRHPIAWN